MRMYFIQNKIAWMRIGTLGIILVLISGVYAYKTRLFLNDSPKQTLQQDANKRLPVLIDLGAGYCSQCKQMAPILEELKKEYAGRVTIKVIDVYDNPDQASKYSIRVIPTQILFDAGGREISRHEGFMPKENLIKAFEQAGVK